MVTTIEDVLHRMEVIAGTVPPGDGVGWFNLVYQRTTEAIRQKLGTGFFHDDVFVERFDVVFASRYFRAFDADASGSGTDAAWRPLFTHRWDRRVHAVQFALAGMNAHINHDLSLALVETCVDGNTYPWAGTIPHDYRRITDVLEENESRIRRMLLDDLERELGRPLEPLVHLIDSWSIAKAREAAWVRAHVQWYLRDNPPLFDQLVAVSASTAGMTSRQLLTPVLIQT